MTAAGLPGKSRIRDLRHAAGAGLVALGLAMGAATQLLAQAPAARRAAPEASDGELIYQFANPGLYAIAREYFPSDEIGTPAKRIFRLTRDQIDQTVQSLLPKYFEQSVKTRMDRDPLQTNYEFAEMLGINNANFGGLSGWIGDIAQRVRKDPAGLFNCPEGAGKEACLRTEATAFVVKAYRGDVGAEKLARTVDFFLKGVSTSNLAQASGDLVEVVLNSPDFLFRKETDVTRTNRLTPAQLLQAVTYTMADAPPEQLGLDSRNAEAYLSRGERAAQTIAALKDSKEARAKLTRFFRAWLEIKEPGDFTISTQVFPEFTRQLSAAMLDETNRFLADKLAKPSPTLKDITQAGESFVSRPLEPIYATKAADASGMKAVALDASRRLGILSQPAVIASHSGPTDSRPIKRGVFWARKVMCMDLEPPPPDLHAKLYEMDGVTERQRIEQSTAGANCVGCHKIINPFGFFLEHYDALGRWRDKDNGHPIDPSIAVEFLDEGPKTAKTTVEALKTFTGSAMFKQCFVRQLFRFYMGREEKASDDPLLRHMFLEFAINDEQDILKVVYMLSSSDRIVRRQ
jgi:hypothetical protein